MSRTLATYDAVMVVVFPETPDKEHRVPVGTLGYRAPLDDEGVRLSAEEVFSVYSRALTESKYPARALRAELTLR